MTIAESLEISIYAIKRLVNHRMRIDVTAGYVVMGVERLRAPMQKITDQIRALAGDTAPAEVLPCTAREPLKGVFMTTITIRGLIRRAETHRLGAMQ